MLAICKREFKSLFNNVIGWLFIGVTLGLYGLYFFVYNLSYGYPYVTYALSAISFIILITVPILTMRVLAEERHAKTDQLLLTSPVSVGKIVVGKYLALAAVYTICIAVISISPLVLRIFGEVALLETYTGILGFWLYGLSCIAIGMFTSSLTESQVVSAVLSFVLLFLGYMMTSLTGIGGNTGNWFTKILDCYDLYQPMENFMNGTFPVTDLIYYISIIFIFLFLTYEALQKRRWTVSKKMISTSVFSVGTIVLVVAAVIAANFGVRKIPSKYTELDLTSKKIYSITGETKAYLKELNDDITIYVYVEKKSKDKSVDKTLSKYEAASKHIQVKYIDPSNNPKFAEKYSQGGLNKNSIVVVCGDRYKVIDYGSEENSYADSQVYEYTMDPSTYSYVPSGYDLEGQVTAALQYVTSESETVIYQLMGHDETALSKAYLDVFDKQFITVKSLNLLQQDAVPKDCEALFITAPESDFSDDDVNKLQSYLDQGGALYISLDYQNFEGLKNVKKFLRNNQIATTESIIGENDKTYYYQNQFYLLPKVVDTDFTQQVAGNTSVFAPYAIVLEYTGENQDDCTVFLESSEDSFAKSYANLSKEREEAEQSNLFGKEEGDESGPFDMGLIIAGENGSKLCVLGSSYIFTENANDMVSGRNAKLFQGVVSELVTTDEHQVAGVVIPVKDYSVSSITVSQRAILVYGLLWGIAMPLVCIVAGVVIWAKRRKR